MPLNHLRGIISLSFAKRTRELAETPSNSDYPWGTAAGGRLFPLHQQHSGHQQGHPGQTNRIEWHPFNSKPAEGVCEIRANHLSKNGSTNDHDDTHSGDGDNGAENKTDSKRAPEISPKRCGLHPSKSGPLPPKAPVIMMHKRIRPPDRKEIAALSTGDSTASRKRALSGPWMEIKKPATTMTRMGRKRIRAVNYSILR